jgi:hypothetical protein
MTVGAIDNKLSVGILDEIRSVCPALQAVFLPDDLWPSFESWHRAPDTAAAHRSMLLLALERGHLHRLTTPIHRYLIEDGRLRPNVRAQYVNDLEERWMLDCNPLERHRESRLFAGRVAELQCAEWLETRDWTITGLEALDAGHDLEARTVSGGVTAFEVKSIGTQDDDFEMILRSMTEEPSGGAVSAYSGINYLLFRVYEAAKQLAGFQGSRIALAVVDDLTWWRFELPLRDGWIDWANPRFLNDDPTWSTFLQEKRLRYPKLEFELASVLGAIDAAWIVRRSHGYQYHLEYELRLRSALPQ